MITSEDPEELKYYWKQWYDKVGTPMRANFDSYIKLRNEAARLNSEKLILAVLRSDRIADVLFDFCRI